MVLNDLEQPRAMAPRFVLARAADADWRSGSNLSKKLNCLPAGRIRQQLSLIAIEGFVALGVGSLHCLLDLCHQLCTWRQHRQPHIEIPIRGPALLRYTARWKSSHAYAQSLRRFGRRSDLKHRELEFLHYGDLRLRRVSIRAKPLNCRPHRWIHRHNSESKFLLGPRR